jgi:hypothetical protein
MHARIAIVLVALFLGGCLRTRFDRCAELLVDCRFLDGGPNGDAGPPVDAPPNDAPPTADAPSTEDAPTTDGGSDAP